jgi:hypothetical protein
MTNTRSFAQRELDILAATVPDAILTPFSKEILALCEAYGRSGQSGGSAPTTAAVISSAIKKLLMQKPICDVTGHEKEWIDVGEYNDNKPWYQNARCSALFKEGIDGRAYYLDAIVWKGEDEYDTFTGFVYMDRKCSELISSRQFVRFPFQPKTFYIDVERVQTSKEWAEARKIRFIEDGNGICHYCVVKNPKQLQAVFKYYDRE